MKNLLLTLAVAAFFTSSAAGQTFDGYALYNGIGENTTYLIDKDGNIAHSWSLNTSCNYTVQLKDNGNIVRGAIYNGNQINGAAVGGMVQEFDPNGNLVWEFIYSDANVVAHHDITLTDKGTVLMIAWERKTSAELQALGYQGNHSYRYATHIIEVEQNGTGGQIIWEWHIWDHFIQDVDQNLPNYGNPEDHPERLNINLLTTGGGPQSGDWFHFNGIDYNEELDQIALTSRFLSEIFIIDHSTTTAEAATSSGGNSGMGGDFMYRWGNPDNYDTPGTQYIAGPVHDVRWIEDDGRKNGGYLQYFNNDGQNGFSSTVDAIETPWNGTTYDLTPGQSYAPSAPNWQHQCHDDAWGQSAHDNMRNGNTFVCLSGDYLYEVDSNDNIIWQYNAQTAKAFRYECRHPGIQALMNVDCNCDDNGTAYLDDCGRCVGGNTGLTECVTGIAGWDQYAEINITPNPTKGMIKISGVEKPEEVHLTVTSVLGETVESSTFTPSVDISHMAAGIYFVNLYVEGVPVVTRKVTLNK